MHNRKAITLIALSCVMMLAMLAPQRACALSKDTYSANSKLSTGTWVKLKVTESGMVRIREKDAQSWGLSGVKNLRVFGYGGAQLPENFSEEYVDDLPQVPVTRNASGDILFYAQGPLTWRYQNSTWIQVQHPYSTEGYYFITNNTEYSDTLVTKRAGGAGGSEVATTFIERVYHEKEMFSAGNTGRELLGEDFRYNTSQSFKFSLPGNYGEDVRVAVHCAAKTGSTATVRYGFSGSSEAGSFTILGTTSADVYYNDVLNFKTLKLATAESAELTVTSNAGSAPSLARLDYITLNYTRKLALSSKGVLQFRGSAATYQVQGDSKMHIWDITNTRKPIEIETKEVEGGVQFNAVATGDREYVAFKDECTGITVTSAGQVTNQDLHGEPVPDLIIIAHKDLVNQSQRLAQLHEEHDGMQVLLVEQSKVFNEFSSGTPDVMAFKKLCKMFYDRASESEAHHLQHLLIVGSVSCDNRIITSTFKPYNYPWVLVWESPESSNKYNSYTSDDPLVDLRDGASDNMQQSIAIGRITARSEVEMRNVVDKISDYLTNPYYGTWKTNLINLADDENDGIHMIQADAVIDNMQRNGGSACQFNRIYIDAYTAVESGSGRTYPEARTKFQQLLNEGVVWLNYTGHANEQSWTGENMLNYTDINSMYNKRWPFVYAATCNFAHYDHVEPCGASTMLTTAKGGCISIFTATREVYISQNGVLNNNVARYAFKRDAEGRTMTIGEMLRRGKNDTGRDDNKFRYVLLGDPALRLHCPQLEARLESINGIPVGSEKMPTFEARQTIELAGTIYEPSGQKATDFNGSVTSTLFDVEQSVESHGYAESKKYVFYDRSNKLAVQMDTVKAGEFKVKLTIPSETIAPDIFDNYAPAKLNLYAYDSSKRREAMGTDETFYIYGYDETIKPDTIGPRIDYMVLNSSNFKDGDMVNESPLLLAGVSDANGLNFSTCGIGHNMLLTLDGTETFQDVGSFFSPTMSASGGNGGTINYALSQLAAGPHTLRLRVWDVYNNSNEKTINFTVVPGMVPNIYDVYAVTNPAITSAIFYVKHDQPESVLNINVEVFDLMGRLVWSDTETSRSDMFTSAPITWDLRDMSGRRVPRGIYVYRATVMGSGKQHVTKSKKIAVAAE